MSRYKYTIALAVVMVVVVGLLVWQFAESRKCHADGGHYVRDFTSGWACVR